MQKKIYIGICVVIVILITLSTGTSYARIGSIRTNRALVQRFVDAGGNQYRIFRKPAITVISPKSFSPHFLVAGQTARGLQSSYACSAVLNGTYFGFNPDGTYFPAGVWYQFGQYLRPPYQPAIDRNLRVLLSGNSQTIDTLVNDDFDFTQVGGQKNIWYANAGPWLVRDGRINPDIVQQKSHWQRSTTRVGFIRNPAGDIHFVVATEPISLPQFISFSYGVGLGTGTFQFVNLDGGSSTSLITPYNAFQPSKTLPSFICIH